MESSNFEIDGLKNVYTQPVTDVILLCHENSIMSDDDDTGGSAPGFPLDD